MKLLTKVLEKKLAMASLTCREQLLDRKIICKFFTPDSQATWWVLEGKPIGCGGDWELFGFVDLGDKELAELGYFYLSSLKDVRGMLGLPIERDRNFGDTTLGEFADLYPQLQGFLA